MAALAAPSLLTPATQAVTPTKSTRKTLVDLEPESNSRIVNLAPSASAASIWKDVLDKDRDALRDICNAMKAIVFGKYGSWPDRLATVSYRGYKNHGGKYLPDSDLFADASGILSRAQMALVQRQYTWSHACSTATFWDEGRNQMAMIRSLDWEGSTAIAKATRIYNVPARGGNPEARILGVVGMVGFLTACKKGAFCVAINYSPLKHSAEFQPDPTFLIRELIENPGAIDFRSALDIVRRWKVGAPCFITLCGIRRDEACVVEFGGSVASLDLEEPESIASDPRPPDARGVIVQTNHYNRSPEIHPQFGPKDDPFCVDVSATSVVRRRLIEEGMSGTPLTAERVLPLWSQEPVLNDETAQVALIYPQDATMKAWTGSPSRPACPSKS